MCSIITNDEDWTEFEDIDIYLKKKYCKIIKYIFDLFF